VWLHRILILCFMLSNQSQNQVYLNTWTRESQLLVVIVKSGFVAFFFSLDGYLLIWLCNQLQLSSPRCLAAVPICYVNWVSLLQFCTRFGFGIYKYARDCNFLLERGYTRLLSVDCCRFTKAFQQSPKDIFNRLIKRTVCVRTRSRKQRSQSSGATQIDSVV
jgi:hypothetical protein